MRTHSARARRAIVLVVAVAATPFIAATSAAAQEVTVVDSKRDVWIYDEQSFDPTRAPDVTEGDIVASRIQHRLRKVIIDTEYRELTPGGRHISQVIMQSDGRRFHYILLRVGPRNPDGQVKVFDEETESLVECEASPRIDYETNTTRITVPRSCLRFPDWIRVAGVHYRMLDSDTFAVDTLGSRQPFPEDWVTPRIHRD